MTRKPPVATIRSRRLAAILREERLAAGLSVAGIAALADLDPASVYRAEKPGCRLSPNNVKSLLQACGTDEEKIRHAVGLAKEAGQRGWWEDYRLSSDHATFVAMESEASAKAAWEPSIIPGLLQTAAYARTVISAGPDYLEPARVERLVRVREQRQKALLREDPLRLTTVIGEAALHCAVGTPALMRDQLAHLSGLARHPNVTVRVLRCGAGAHPGMTGPFAILRYPDSADPGVLYVESLAGALWVDKPAEVERAHRAFDRLAALSLSPDASIGLIAEVAVSV